MSLVGLPVELFEEILDHLCFSDYKSLRLVGLSKFNKVLISRLFKDYYINFDVDCLANLSHASRIEPIATSIRTLHLDTEVIDKYITREAFESRRDLRPSKYLWIQEQMPPNAQYMHQKEQVRMKIELDKVYDQLDRKGGLSADELTAGFDAFQAYRHLQLEWSENHDRELQQALSRLPKLRSVRADNFALFGTRDPPPVWRRVASKTRQGPMKMSSVIRLTHTTFHADRPPKTRALASLVRALDYRLMISGNEPLRELEIEILYGWDLSGQKSGDTLPDHFQSSAGLKRLVVICSWLDDKESIDTTNLRVVGQMLTASKALVDLSLEVTLDRDSESPFLKCDFLGRIGNPRLSNVERLKLEIPIKGPTLLDCLARSSTKSLYLKDCVLLNEGSCNTWREVINRLHQVSSLESYYFEGLWDHEADHIQPTRNWFDYGFAEDIEDYTEYYSPEYCEAVRDAIVNGVPLQTLVEPPREERERE